MFNGHDPYLVALSVVIASLGGYTGFGLAARIRATPGASRRLLLAGAAGFLAVGVWTMHYVGIHGLSGDFHIEHDPAMVSLAVLIAIGAAYGGLKIFLARQGGLRLMLSAIAFGIAVSGMHYTAMYGMHFRPELEPAHVIGGPVVSSHALTLIVAVLCFLVVAAFLLFLVPEPRRRTADADAGTIEGQPAPDPDTTKIDV